MRFSALSLQRLLIADSDLLPALQRSDQHKQLRLILHSETSRSPSRSSPSTFASSFWTPGGRRRSARARPIAPLPICSQEVRRHNPKAMLLELMPAFPPSQGRTSPRLFALSRPTDPTSSAQEGTRKLSGSRRRRLPSRKRERWGFGTVTPLPRTSSPTGTKLAPTSTSRSRLSIAPRDCLGKSFTCSRPLPCILLIRSCSDLKTDKSLGSDLRCRHLLHPRPLSPPPSSPEQRSPLHLNHTSPLRATLNFNSSKALASLRPATLLPSRRLFLTPAFLHDPWSLDQEKRHLRRLSAPRPPTADLRRRPLKTSGRRSVSVSRRGKTDRTGRRQTGLRHILSAAAFP